MRTHKIRINENGIGLVEVIAALGISVVVITSLLSLTLFSLRTSLQSTIMMEATKAANKQMELFRAYRDVTLDTSDWDTFVATVTTSCGVSCYVSPTLTLTTGTTPVNVSGTTVNVGVYASQDVLNPRIIHARASAAWSIGTQSKATYVYTDFTDWQD